MRKSLLVAVGGLACGAGAFIAWAGGIEPARARLALISSDFSNSRGAPPSTPAGPPAKGGPGGPPPSVTVSIPVQRSIVEWDEYTGRFDAVDSVDIRARISGYLNEVHFKDGQIVKKGDILYSIDPRPFERALDQAKAEHAQASTKAENATLDVDRG